MRATSSLFCRTSRSCPCQRNEIQDLPNPSLGGDLAPSAFLVSFPSPPAVDLAQLGPPAFCSWNLRAGFGLRVFALSISFAREALVRCLQVSLLLILWVSAQMLPPSRSLHHPLLSELSRIPEAYFSPSLSITALLTVIFCPSEFIYFCFLVCLSPPPHTLEFELPESRDFTGPTQTGTESGP